MEGDRRCSIGADRTGSLSDGLVVREFSCLEEQPATHTHHCLFGDKWPRAQPVFVALHREVRSQKCISGRFASSGSGDALSGKDKSRDPQMNTCLWSSFRRGWTFQSSSLSGPYLCTVWEFFHYFAPFLFVPRTSRCDSIKLIKYVCIHVSTIAKKAAATHKEMI